MSFKYNEDALLAELVITLLEPMDNTTLLATMLFKR